MLFPARDRPQPAFFMIHVTAAVRTTARGFGGMAAPRIGGHRRRLRPKGRSRMHRASATTQPGGTTGRTLMRSTGTAVDRLAGTNGAGINGPSGDRARGTSGRHPGPRHRRSTRWRFREARDHIRPRWNDRPRDRLSCQIRFCRRTQRASSTNRLRRRRH